jgi:hypothetical protein
MINDFDTATLIDMNDVVATANNKMEFLLDKAEARLRDTALCGWGLQDDRCLMMIIMIINVV